MTRGCSVHDDALSPYLVGGREGGGELYARSAGRCLSDGRTILQRFTSAAYAAAVDRCLIGDVGEKYVSVCVCVKVESIGVEVVENVNITFSNYSSTMTRTTRIFSEI